ncbi:hypothetical protein H4W19_12685 [Pseudoxanthomonas mexicana]|uniref:DUF3102 domain-containing protein n=1 Tax=Pseudoxanthomonas mexicana TaxID=128785 RepID=A0ABX6R9N3_PSEMX|nr:DUF5677 domain-containing protein [Pseudoxanthomonas mexicana]MCR6625814.1 hypothetical protein [Pseudoxanthomonas sp.]QND79213.1 hypothetical protein H4W19_12685 [Pseudoxanthomonas mexicana]
MLSEILDSSLLQAKAARSSLKKLPSRIVGRSPSAKAGEYLENYSQCLINRQIDIFDDTLLLLENERIASACALSRGMIETYAFSRLLGEKISKILDSKSGQESVDACIDITLKFTNSSRFKQSEQKRVASNIFDIADYHLTDEAIKRLLNSLATSEHVLNALRELYADEMKHTNMKESQFEITYDILSEWVHPSQTSIFHQYTSEAHLVPTSYGMVSILDGAKLNCARAMQFIIESKEIHQWLIHLSKEMTKRSVAADSSG